MPAKRPVRRMTVPEEAAPTLMGNQDTRHKGTRRPRAQEGKCITFWVTDEQKAEISAYAAEQ